jgi:hypothetical protein
MWLIFTGLAICKQAVEVGTNIGWEEYACHLPVLVIIINMATLTAVMLAARAAIIAPGWSRAAVAVHTRHILLEAARLLLVPKQAQKVVSSRLLGDFEYTLCQLPSNIREP